MGATVSMRSTGEGPLCINYRRSWDLQLTSTQEDPYKFTTISKDLQKVATVSGDFLVQEGQVSFVTTDRSGDIRMLDFDPAGESCLIVPWHRDRPRFILTCVRSRLVQRRETRASHGVSRGP